MRKRLKILHILSQHEVTGAEAYACALASVQETRGHTIYVISDTLQLPFRGTYVPCPIGKRDLAQRIRNIMFLVRFLRVHRIDIVHAHSRAASWISFFASKIAGVPFVSTVHGRQHLHLSCWLFNAYGKHIVTVSESLRQHLIDDLLIDPSYVRMIPNAIQTDRWRPIRKRKRAEKTIMFVGRLSGPKGDVVRTLLREVFPAVESRVRSSITVVGGKTLPGDLRESAEAINERLGRPAVQFKGFTQNVEDEIAQANVVIGSGRVVPEALMMGKPVFAFGESGYVGNVNEQTYSDALQTNFGDTGIREAPNPETIAEELISFLQEDGGNSLTNSFVDGVRNHFDACRVEERVNEVYRRAIVRLQLCRRIPVLMYHRVVNEAPKGSCHGIWITADQFEQQLRSLKRRGFQTMTFRDYGHVLQGLMPLSGKPIILTFDDGYEDNYTVAYPLLRSYGCTAVIFSVADLKRRTNFWDPEEPCARLMSVSQLRELESYGIEIGSHSITHPRLAETSRSEAEHEIRHSKEILEDALGRGIRSFAYPYGRLNQRVKSIVEESGYHMGVAADTGPTKIHADHFEIQRTQIFPGTEKFGFWKKTQTWYPCYRRLYGFRYRVRTTHVVFLLTNEILSIPADLAPLLLSYPLT